MGYCETSDVTALVKSRKLGVGNNPSAQDVEGYIEGIASELDAILIEKGYTVPIDQQYTGAFQLLSRINAVGAAAVMEESSPQSVNVDRLRKDYDSAKSKLEKARSVMDAPQDIQRAGARGPGLTSQPTGTIYDPTDVRRGDIDNDPSDPYFSRETRY